MHRDEGGTERKYKRGVRGRKGKKGERERGEREKESHADAAASQTKTRHD